MAAVAEPRTGRPIHLLHAVLLAAGLPLFLGGLLSDIAYGKTYEIQWINFASWLIAGGMVFAGLVLVWALVHLLRTRGGRGRALIYFLVVLAVFVLGLVNSFVHARDAWGSMPEGLILSALVVVLSVVATWIGFSSLRAGRVG